MLRAALLLSIVFFGHLNNYAQSLSTNPGLPYSISDFRQTGQGNITLFDSADLKPLDKVRRQRVFLKSLAISVPLIAAGAYGTMSTKIINKYEIKEERDEHFSTFHTHADNYLALAPAAMVYGLHALGVKGQHDIWNQTILLAKSELIMEAIVFSTKRLANVQRPDGSNHQSFPSGHTAQAFVSAEFLRKEYGSAHPWIAISGYTMAASVGALRMLNNKHWLPDVLAGAGIGILSVNVAYLTHQNKWHFGNKKMSMVPTYSGNQLGVYMNYRLGK